MEQGRQKRHLEKGARRTKGAAHCSMAGMAVEPAWAGLVSQTTRSRKRYGG